MLVSGKMFKKGNKMTYKKIDGGFEVDSRSGLDKKWIVSSNMSTCNCPKFKYYLKGQSPCHHILEVIEGEKTASRVTPVKQGIKLFNADEYDIPLSIEEFTRIYGDEQLDALISTHSVLVFKGKIRKL